MGDELKPKDTENPQDMPQEPAEEVSTDKPGKTFTQAELDKVISDRLARERAKMPAADKLKAFEEWQKSQQTEAEKAAEREKEFAKLQGEAETLKRENMAIKAGVNNGDVDYVLFKVGKMEGEFADNLKTFLAENTKYTEPETATVEGMKHKPPKSGDDDVIVAAARKAAGL